jgi:hypothetical protein
MCFTSCSVVLFDVLVSVVSCFCRLDGVIIISSSCCGTRIFSFEGVVQAKAFAFRFEGVELGVVPLR